MSFRYDLDSHLDDDLSYMISVGGDDGGNKDEEQGETKALLMKVMNENRENKKMYEDRLREQEVRHNEQMKRLEEAMAKLSYPPEQQSRSSASFLRSSAASTNLFEDEKVLNDQVENSQSRESFENQEQSSRIIYRRMSSTYMETFLDDEDTNKKNEEVKEEEKRGFLIDEEDHPNKGSNNKAIVRMKFAEDTFSIMMLSPLISWGYFLGIATFGFQIALAFDYIYSFLDFTFVKGFADGKDEFGFRVPIGVSRSVRFGQYCVALLSIWLSSDIQIAIQYLLAFRRGSENVKTLKDNQIRDVVVIPSGGFMRRTIYFPKLRQMHRLGKKQSDVLGQVDDDETLYPSLGFMWRAVYFPNIIRFFQSIVVILMLMILIIQNNDFIELLMNFTALFIISQIDDIVFQLVKRGYFFGFQMSEIASKIEKMQIIEEKKRGRQYFFSPVFVGSIILGSISLCMIVFVAIVARLQTDGYFLKLKYPLCDVSKENYALIGDGKCDGGDLNSLICNWEGGDCIEFNEKFPGCQAELPYEIGDGTCNYENNIVACGYDGGDCCPYGDPLNLEELPDGNRLKNRNQCNGGLYSTALWYVCQIFHQLNV